MQLVEGESSQRFAVPKSDVDRTSMPGHTSQHIEGN